MTDPARSNPEPFEPSWLDSFIGPNATKSEKLIQLVPPVIYTILLLYRAISLDVIHSILQYIVFVLLVFDMTGGVLTNATMACKKWYFRPGQTARQHLGFAFIHVIHILLVALIFRSSHSLTFFLSASIAFLFASVSVALTPLYLKNVMAMFMVLNAFFLDLYVWTPTPGLEWFIPLLFIKICAGHLVPLLPIGQQNEESSLLSP